MITAKEEKLHPVHLTEEGLSLCFFSIFSSLFFLLCSVLSFSRGKIPFQDTCLWKISHSGMSFPKNAASAWYIISITVTSKQFILENPPSPAELRTSPQLPEAKGQESVSFQTPINLWSYYPRHQSTSGAIWTELKPEVIMAQILKIKGSRAPKYLW